MPYWPCALAVLLAVAKPVGAGDQTPWSNDDHAQSSETQQETTKRLIRQLDAPSYSLRRQAFTDLWRMGAAATPWIEEAALQDNKQVAESARRLKLLIKLRDYCDDIQTAESLIELLSVPLGENLAKLAMNGHWRLMSIFLDEHPAFAIRAQESFYQQGDTIALIQALMDLALERQQVESAWPVILRLVPIELALWTSEHLSLQATLPPLDEYEQAMKLFFSGDLDQALDLHLSPQLKLRLATRGFRWQLLQDPSVQEALLEGRPSISQQAARAVLIEFSGDRFGAGQLWSQLLQQEDPADPSDKTASPNPADHPMIDALRGAASDSQDPSSYHQLLYSLMMAGHTEMVDRFLEEHSPLLAFDLHIATNDYARAFRQVGLDADLGNFDSWLERLAAEAKASLPEALRNPFEDTSGLRPAATLGKVGSILVGLGYRAEAMKILERLVRLGQRNYRSQNPIWDRCILRWLGRDEWRSCCIEFIGKNSDQLPKSHRHAIFSKLFPELGGYAWKLHSQSPGMTDGQPEDEQYLLALEQMDRLQRCDREYFGSDARLVIKDWIFRALSAPDEEENSVPEGSSGLLSLVKLTHSMGFSSAALDLLQIGMSQTLDSYRLLHHAAKLSLESQNAEAALEYLNAASPGMSDHHHDVDTRIQSKLVLGQMDEARLDYLAHWCRMAGVSWNGDRSAGYRVVEDLISERRWEQALPYARRNFQLDRFVSYYFGFWEARQYSRILQELKEYERSADVMRAVFVELLRPFSQTLRVFFDNEELSLLRYCAVRERISRAMGLIENGDYRNARQELEIAERLQPLDIEAVVHCFPLWQQAGQQEFAEGLFLGYEKSLLQHLENWPKDAMNLNNLAWMYAQCDRQLDKALELSQRAVRLAPSSAVYLDTLAEVYFRLGDHVKAIETMRQCVGLDPREPHYRENLVRFAKR